MGQQRFEHFLAKVESLLNQAASDKNPALWLYSNDLRTPMFMLEALCRLYSKLHNNKKFSKLKEHFKLLEDGLGAIDYYDNYAKIFFEHPTVPVHIREYMQGQAREKIQHINDILVTNQWIGDNPVRLQKIRKKLSEADWMPAKKEAKAVADFYKEETAEIKKMFAETGGRFTQVENQLHEFRREIRWLSIYPQALLGMVQLTVSPEQEDTTGKYLADEIVSSKYNVMPDAGENEWFLLLEKNHFYALSWMIAETGKLKDEGLQFFAAAEAIQQIEGMNQIDALQKSFEMFAAGKDPLSAILDKASAIAVEFMKEQQLDKLVYGIGHIQESKSNAV